MRWIAATAVAAALAIGCHGGGGGGAPDGHGGVPDGAARDALPDGDEDLDAAALDAAALDAAALDAAPIDASVAAQLQIEPAELDFGIVEVGQLSAPGALTIRNVGDAATGVSLSLTGASFVISAEDCTTLAPDQTCTATVRLAATDAGAATGSLLAEDDGGGVASATLSGAGGYRVTVIRQGAGTVTSTPAGIDCGATCSALFVGPTVDLTAAWASPTEFVGWSGDCGGAADCTLVLDGPKTVGATFRTSAGLGLEVVGLGAGEVTLNYGTDGRCVSGPPCHFDLNAGANINLRANPIGDSVFVGWSGACTGTATDCALILDGADDVTATFAPAAGVDWVRTVPRLGALAADLAVGAGRVVVGGGSPAWLAAFTLDGASIWYFVDASPSAVLSVAVDSSGASVVAVAVSSALVVRRYLADGSLDWSVTPGGTSGGTYGRGVAVDASDNIYVVGNDGAPYVASYTAAGIERWRRAVTASELHGIAVRGGLVAAVGKEPPDTDSIDGWIATFDLAGTPGWTAPFEAPLSAELVLHDVAIDSDLDVVIGGRFNTGGSNSILAGAQAAAGSAEQWHTFTSQRGGNGDVAACPDDSVALLSSYTLGANAQLRFFAESGPPALWTTTLAGESANAGGLACDGAGDLYYAYNAVGPGYPAIEWRAP